MTPGEKQKIWEIFKPYIKEAALAYCLDELNAMPEGSEFVIPKTISVSGDNSEQVMLAKLEKEAQETQIAKRKIWEYIVSGATDETGKKNIAHLMYWLDQGGE